MSAVKREEYFKETEPSEWSLVSFLSWRSKQHEVLQMSLEYSTWKSFIENIVNNSQLQYIVILHRERLKNCLDPTISLWILVGCLSLLLDTFGRSMSQPNDRMPQSIAEHIWVVPEPNQVMVPEPCSLKYIIDKSEAATTHSALMGERRSQILESELKHKRKDFFQSPAEVSTNVLIKQ
ncbi:21109_t:CDS:2 [Rhizophagus irregularis]|nr:21109_t:CDS:2 [Rhizophagus irregularis]